jgi:hypothetical protein
VTLDEILLASLWLLFLTALVLDLVGVLHRGTGYRWQALGLLVMNTAQEVNLLAHLHSRGIFPVLLVGFALFVVGVVVSAKAHRSGPQPGQPIR